VRNGTMDPSQIHRGQTFNMMEGNQWNNGTMDNRQMTLNRQFQPGSMGPGSPGFPGGTMQQSASATDLQSLPGMDGHPGMPPMHYPHYPMNPQLPPHYPYPMYPPHYPNYPQYFGNSFANLSSQPTTTDGDASDQSEASSRHHSGRKYPFRKRAKRSQSVMIDRMAYPGQFYPFGPFPPGYGPGPWGAPFPMEAPPSPASSIRSLNRVGRTRRRKKLTSEDDDEEFSMSSSPMSRPKSSSSERPLPAQKSASKANRSTSSEEEDSDTGNKRESSRNRKDRTLRRESDPRRLPSPVPKSPQITHKKTSKLKDRETLKHTNAEEIQASLSMMEGRSSRDSNRSRYSDAEEMPGSPARRSSRDSNIDQTEQDEATSIWTPHSSWQCKHCTFINSAGNRICQVCCKTATAEETTLVTSRPASASSRKQSLESSEKSSSSPEKRMEEDQDARRDHQDMEVLNSALDEAEKEISRGLEELMKLKEEYRPVKSKDNDPQPSTSKPPSIPEASSSKPVYKSTGKMRTSILDKIIPPNKKSTASTSTSTETQTGPNSKTDRILEARRPSTSSTTSDAYNSPTAQSPQLGRMEMASSRQNGVENKSGVRKDSSCQTQTDDLMDFYERKKAEEEAFLASNAFGYRYGDRMDTVNSPTQGMFDRGYGMMQRSHSRASLFTGRLNDFGPMDYGFGQRPMYRSVSRSSLTGDYPEGRLSDFQNLRKPDYYLSMEELVERRRQESIRAQGLELVRMIREAEQQGFTADDIQVALTNCGKQNPLEWLQENWKIMVENVINLSTSYANDKKENDIGTVSENEAREALRLHKGHIWASVTECVETRQRKFLELKTRGKFSSKEITDALTSSQGDVEMAYAKLTKSTSKPFLMRIWGAGEGAQNKDGAIPKSAESFKSHIETYSKDDIDVDDVQSDELWDEEEEDVEWDEDYDEQDDEEEHEDIDLQTCRDDVYIPNDVTTPDSDRSDYLDAFGSNANTLERNVSSPGSDTFFVIPDVTQTKKSNGLLSKLAALRKDGKDTKQTNAKFYDEDLDAFPDNQIHNEEEEQQKTYNPISMIKNTITAIRDSVSGASKNEKKVPCAAPEKRTIIVSGQIAHESLNDDHKQNNEKPNVTKPTTENVSLEADNFSKQNGARPKHTITKESSASNEKVDKVNIGQETKVKPIENTGQETKLKLTEKTEQETKISPTENIKQETKANPTENIGQEVKLKVTENTGQKTQLKSTEITRQEIQVKPTENTGREAKLKPNETQNISNSKQGEPNVKIQQINSAQNLNLVKDKSPRSETETTTSNKIDDKKLNAGTTFETKSEMLRTGNLEDIKKSPTPEVTEITSTNKTVDKQQSLSSSSHIDKQHREPDHVKNKKHLVIEEDKASPELPEHPPVFSSVKSNDKSFIKSKEQSIHNENEKFTSSAKDSVEVKVNENLKKESSSKLSGEKNIIDHGPEEKETLDNSNSELITQNSNTNLSNNNNSTSNMEDNQELRKNANSETLQKDHQNTKLPVTDSLQSQAFNSNGGKKSPESQIIQTKLSNAMGLKESVDKNLEEKGKKALNTQVSSKNNTDILKKQLEKSDAVLNSGEAISEAAQQSENSALPKSSIEHEHSNNQAEFSSQTDKNRFSSDKSRISPPKERKTPVKETNNSYKSNTASATGISSHNVEKTLSETKLSDVNIAKNSDNDIEIVDGSLELKNEIFAPIIKDSVTEKLSTTSDEAQGSSFSSDSNFKKTEIISKSLEGDSNVSNSSNKSINESETSESTDAKSIETAKQNSGSVQNDHTTADKITPTVSNVSDYKTPVSLPESANSLKAIERTSVTEDKQSSSPSEAVSMKRELAVSEKINESLQNIPSETETPLESGHISNKVKSSVDKTENDILDTDSSNGTSKAPVESLPSSSSHTPAVKKGKEALALETQSSPPTEKTLSQSPSTSVSSDETALSSSSSKTNLQTSVETNKPQIAETIDRPTDKTIPSEINNILSPESELRAPKVSEIPVTETTNASHSSENSETLAVDKSESSVSDALSIGQGTSNAKETDHVIQTVSSATSSSAGTEQTSSTSNTTPQSNTASTSSLKSETTSKKHSRVTFKDEKDVISDSSSSNVSAGDIVSDSKPSESLPESSSTKSEAVPDSEQSSDDSDLEEEIDIREHIRKGSLTLPSPVEALRNRFEGLAEDNYSGVIRPQSPYRRMSFRSTKAAIALEKTRDTSGEKPWYQSKTTVEQKKAPPKRSIKQQLDIDRKVRNMVADRKVRTYRKAEIVVQLMDMNFEEEEAIQAANECSTLEQAISFLQQECLLCAGHFPVSHMVSMVHCPHKACRECIRAYFTVQIRDRNIMELLCPFCNEPDIFDEDIAQDYFNHLDIMLKKLVDFEIHELFQRKLRDRVLMRDPNFRWCSQCSSGFIAMENLKRLVCPDCNAVMCASCRRPWEKEHQGISCEAFAALKDANDVEAQAAGLAKLLIEDGIDCPVCHFRYALAKGGCMHFRCTQCQHDFCSGCSRPFKMGQLSKVKYDRDPPEGMDVKRTCQVMEQKETSDGLVDDCCGKETEDGFAGLCRIHYVEYLGQLVNKHKVDPIQIFEVDDLELVLRRANIRLPAKRYRENDVQYRERLIKIIQEELPLDEMDGS
ncbi:e3 ubiquitin-protein ligase RNF31, partial [Nephila pilipes]